MSSMSSKRMGTWDENAHCCFTIVIVLRIMELIMLLATMCIFVMYLYIMHRKKFLHANLRYMLLKLVIYDVILLCIRLIDVFDFSGLYQIGTVIDYTRSSVWIYMTFGILTLQGERIYALLNYETYEQHSSRFPRAPFFAFGVETIVASVLMAARATGIASKNIIVGIEVGATIAALIIHIVLQYKTKRRYRDSLDISLSTTVSGRFQMVEMYFSSRMFRIFIPVQGIYLMINISSFFVLFSIAFIIPFEFQIAYTSAYVLVYPRVLMSMLLPIVIHPSLRKELKRILRLNRTRVEAISSSIQSSTGKQLSFVQSREKDIYFDSYRTMWN